MTTPSQTATLAVSTAQTPSLSPLLRLRTALLDAAPSLCLVATLGAAGAFYWGGGGDPRGQVVGFAQVVPEMVAPIETGRVSTLQVSIGSQVATGQIVATLDTSSLDAEIAVAEAEKARLEAEMQVEQSVLEQRLDVDLEGLERERARQREEQARVSAEAKVLDGEVARVTRLVADRQAVLDDLTQLGLRQATASALASAKPRTLGLLGKQIQAAEERRQKAKERTSAVAAKLAAGLLVAARQIELLQRRREGYVLRASHAGRVSSIDRRAGEVVQSGTPVVQLVSAQERVVACVPERSALGLREGDAARLRVRGQSGAPLRGKVVVLGPLVTELPTRCWTTPRVPLWGREVTIALDEVVEVVPGQAFEISFETAASAAAPAAATAVAAPGTGALPMAVPKSLGLLSRFEPSGLVARSTEGRYVVVSDDTGRDGDEGVPWLFAMSASGAVEPEPVPVSGVSEVNDLEGITAGADGEIYLLSSQSFSKKGRRKPARTALLRLRPEGRGFRVDGEVHLAEWLDANPERAAALGLPDGTRSLDVEGLAFRQGALYLGLKAPLDAHGNAMIWKIGSPGALFEMGGYSVNHPKAGSGEASAVEARRFLEAGISLWASARVDVSLGGQATPGGISDLLFSPDGSLALASTPSTAEGAAGALWRVDEPQPGVLAPRLVQAFPGQKPEGLAQSLSPGKLMVVFDAGNGTPAFQELPWGR